MQKAAYSIGRRTCLEPYKLCTFSRVIQEKGIEDAIKSVISVNEQLRRTVYTLDIYGPVDQNQTEWFDKLQNSFPKYIKYKGVIESSKSVEVLKDYFALLFPTHYYTEGIPGTVIDAYAAGVPVISSKWESFSDLIDDGITGIGYAFDNTDELTKLLLCMAEQPQIILNLKRACIAKAEKFTPETVVDILVRGGGKK